MSGRIRGALLGALGIAYSRHGLEAGLVPFLPEGRPIVAIDVGSSDGLFTAILDSHSGLRRALLIEPQPARCQQLRERFRDARFVIENCAASSTDGTVEMDILNFDYSSSILPVLADVGGAGTLLDLGLKTRIQVPTRTLDGLVVDAGLDGDIDLLKIDTQGAELHVLHGARVVLPRVRLVWVEVSFRALYEGSALFADVHAFLGRHGFHLRSLHDGFRGVDGELLQADALFVRSAVQNSPTDVG